MSNRIKLRDETGLKRRDAGDPGSIGLGANFQHHGRKPYRQTRKGYRKTFTPPGKTRKRRGSRAVHNR